MAARAVARRIAEEREWTLGREVGWQIRFEKRFTRDTRLLVVTEGILTARLQQDPLLVGFRDDRPRRVSRAKHSCRSWARARAAGVARARRSAHRRDVGDARRPIGCAHFSDDAPVVSVPGALHPLTIEHARRGVDCRRGARRAAENRRPGACAFFPARARSSAPRSDLSIAGRVRRMSRSFRCTDRSTAMRRMPRFAPSSGRRIILATNIAETSLTVPGVSAVIDTGQVKVARYDADRGVDSLTLERITPDSADQRAGRAARLGPGLVRRLWDARDRLRPHREPEIARVDLAAPVLDLLAWGADPLSFDWFEAPSADRIQAALRLLRRLGAIDGDEAGARITALGRQTAARSAPSAPRAHPASTVAARPRPRQRARGCRWVRRVRWVQWVRWVRWVRWMRDAMRQVAQELQRIASSALGGDVAAHITDEALRHALFTGYADRLAKRRPGSRDRFLLATGHGAALAREAAGVDARVHRRARCRGGRARRHQRVENSCGQRGRARVDSADVDIESSIASTPRAAACARRASSATTPSC